MLKSGKKDKKDKNNKKDKKQSKDKKKKFQAVVPKEKRQILPGIHELKTPLSENSVLFNIKLVFVGNPCTLDSRKKLMWGYYHKHHSESPTTVGTYSKDVTIDGYDGRVTMTLYDNNVDKNISYFPFSGVHCVFLVYQYDDEMSFRHIYNWLSEARRFCNKDNVFAYVIGVYPNEESTKNISEEHKAILHLMKLQTFNYYPGNESVFDDFVNEKVCNVRQINFKDEVLDIQYQKLLFESGNYKKSKKGFVPIQSQLESSQRRQMEKDPYRRLISQEIDRGFTYLMRIVFCGDDITTTTSRKIACGVINGFDQPVKTSNLDNLATTYIEIDNKYLKLRAVGYDTSYKKSLQYAPFVNSLGSVIFFDYTNIDSFNHLMIWVKESYRGNLDGLQLFICGLNSTAQKKDVSSGALSDYLATFPKERKPFFCDWDENNKEHFISTFKQYVNTIRRNIFRKNYLSMVEKEMLNKERMGSIDSSEMLESSKLMPSNFKEDEDDGSHIEWFR
ncbi:Ras family protein [Entamoeba marina]